MSLAKGTQPCEVGRSIGVHAGPFFAEHNLLMVGRVCQPDEVAELVQHVAFACSKPIFRPSAGSPPRTGYGGRPAHKGRSRSSDMPPGNRSVASALNLSMRRVSHAEKATLPS